MLIKCQYCGCVLSQEEENLYGEWCTSHYQEYEEEFFPVWEREDEPEELNFDRE